MCQFQQCFYKYPPFFKGRKILIYLNRVDILKGLLWKHCIYIKRGKTTVCLFCQFQDSPLAQSQRSYFQINFTVPSHDPYIQDQDNNQDGRTLLIVKHHDLCMYAHYDRLFSGLATIYFETNMCYDLFPPFKSRLLLAFGLLLCSVKT